MSLLDTLRRLNTAGLEQEISEGIIKKIADTLPELTDHSPGSPHVVIGEGVAWGTALLLYYVAEQPQLFEEYLLETVYHATPRPPTNATSQLQLTFALPAPAGGRTLSAGTQFTGGGATWTLLETYTYPEGTLGNESYLQEGVRVWSHLVPVVCDVPGARYNTAPGTLNAVTQITPGLISVTNPSAATGGADQESYAEMRERYFGGRLDGDLLVLSLDFERAVTKYLGPGSRVHVVTPPPTPGYVHLSVLYPDGTPLVAHEQLEAHLNGRSPMAPVRWASPDLRDVAVEATLHYDPNLVSPASLRVQAEQLTRAYLDPRTWPHWGETPNTLYRSELIALLQGVTGVLSVDLAQPAADLPLGLPNAAPRAQSPLITLRPVSAPGAQET